MASLLQDRYNRALDDTGRRSRQADDEYYRRATSFDPYAAVERSATGAFNLLQPELNRAVRALRGQQVGMGRLNTGFATEDEDRLVSDAYQRLTDSILANSMQAAGLDLQATNSLGNYAAGQQQQYLDLLSGGLDREQAEENARRKRRGGIGALIGAGLGAAIGSFVPRIGTELGAELGSYLGGTAGSVF